MAAAERTNHLRNKIAGAFLAGIPVLALSSSLHAQTNSGDTAQASARNFSVAAGSLENALLQLGRQANLRIAYPSEITRGKRSSGVSGNYSAQDALAQVLSGSGLNYSFTNANTVTIFNGTTSASAQGAPIDAGDSTLLDTITVSGGNRTSVGWDGTEETVYSTPGSVNFVSRTTIDRFGGQNVSDIVRTTPGVLSGEARSSGGLDANIRGMQGLDRVPVTVDGATNQSSVNRGYQGMTSRSYFDPDFIGGVSIEKGPTSGPGVNGIGGAISMRTISADDIVRPGERWGIRVKGSLIGNSSKPIIGKETGYKKLDNNDITPVMSLSPYTNRPSFLDLPSGGGSVVGAYKSENFDLVAGYARRKTGNYHAGSHGGQEAELSFLPPTQPGRPPSAVLNGDTKYRYGEEVFNTSQDVRSFLLKGTFRFSEDQTLDLAATTYSNWHGETGALNNTQALLSSWKQLPLNKTKLNSYTARYSWNPADNDLINLKANAWLTDMKDLHSEWMANQLSSRPDHPLFGNLTKTWGADISNTSVFDTSLGHLNWEYGVSYMHQDTKPSSIQTLTNINTPTPPPRNGIRQEVTAFTRAQIEFNDRWTALAGLQYQHFWSEDKFSPLSPTDNPDRSAFPDQSDGGFSPSVGIVYTPVQGWQIFGNYKQGMRLPSLAETVQAFSYKRPDLRPERSHYWELGANAEFDQVLTGDDKLSLKGIWFLNNVDDFIGRRWDLGMQFINFGSARFSGLEFNGKYSFGSTEIDLAANYYLDVRYCTQEFGCQNAGVPNDYSNNQTPPKYMVSATVSQKLFDDALTVGGRITHYGKRAVPSSYGSGGANDFVSPINYRPVTLVDAFLNYKITDDLQLALSVENLTDQYYVDPLSVVLMPAPGRTVRFDLTGRIGSGTGGAWSGWPSLGIQSKPAVDWTGFYAGGELGYLSAGFDGTATTATGVYNERAENESANADGSGLAYGAHVGFNYQFANGVVTGIEAGISRVNLTGIQDTETTEGMRYVSLQSQAQYDIDWLATVRGKLGIAYDRYLVYGTGGVAFTRETQSRTQYRADKNNYRSEPAFSEEAESTRVGWTLGAGMEYALSSNWSLSTEYSYTRFGKKDFLFPGATSGVTLPSDGSTGTSEIVDGRKASNSLDVHSLKMGINYRF